MWEPANPCELPKPCYPLPIMPTPSRTSRYILLGTVVLLLFVAFDACTLWYLAHRTVNLSEFGIKPLYQTPEPNQALGVTIYPRADVLNPADRIPAPRQATSSAYLATNDSREQVVAFYRSRYPSSTVVADSDSFSSLLVNFGDADFLLIGIYPKSPTEKRTRIVYNRFTNTKHPPESSPAPSN